MNDAKYIGLDVHQATISVAVLDSSGKLVMEAILETQTSRVQDNFRVADKDEAAGAADATRGANGKVGELT